MQLNFSPRFIARSALSVRGDQKIGCPCSFFVRRIIDFCEGDMEGASPLLSTGSLNFWFWRIQKWTPLKKFKSWYRPVQGPLFGPSFWDFLATYWKTMLLIPARFYARWRTLSSWNFELTLWRARYVPQSSGTWKYSSTRTKSVASRPCRARCI